MPVVKAETNEPDNRLVEPRVQDGSDTMYRAAALTVTILVVAVATGSDVSRRPSSA